MPAVTGMVRESDWGREIAGSDGVLIGKQAPPLRGSPLEARNLTARAPVFAGSPRNPSPGDGALRGRLPAASVVGTGRRPPPVWRIGHAVTLRARAVVHNQEPADSPLGRGAGRPSSHRMAWPDLPTPTG